MRADTIDAKVERVIESNSKQKDGMLTKLAEETGMEVITKLDKFGDINADFTEVTVLTKKKNKNNPPLTPLAEAVSAVAQHQAAGFLTGDDSNITPNSEPSSALGENSPENGVKFSYTTRQWKEIDKAYLDAVQRGDMETAERNKEKAGKYRALSGLVKGAASSGVLHNIDDEGSPVKGFNKNQTASTWLKGSTARAASVRTRSGRRRELMTLNSPIRHIHNFPFHAAMKPCKALQLKLSQTV